MLNPLHPSWTDAACQLVPAVQNGIVVTSSKYLNALIMFAALLRP